MKQKGQYWSSYSYVEKTGRYYLKTEKMESETGLLRKNLHEKSTTKDSTLEPEWLQ